MMDELTLVQRYAVWILPVIFAVTMRETARAWAAKKRGDPTAAQQGRLAFNPIKHFDLMGTLLVPSLLIASGTAFIFGWAKPIPLNERNFKKPRQDLAVVSLAGPLANFSMALAWALVARGGIFIGKSSEFVAYPLVYAGMAGIAINLALAVISLLPIPPLDGSRILSAMLPARWAWQYHKFDKYGFIIILVLLSTNVLSAILQYPLFFLQNRFLTLAGF